MKPSLLDLGLTDLQASAYLYLLDNGDLAPPQLAKALGMTRTNAYKVLETLEEMDLVTKSEVAKKFQYHASDPSALSSLIAEKRLSLIVLEKTTQTAIQELRRKYESSNQGSQVNSRKGKSAMSDAYETQAKLDDDEIYFIKTRSDIPFMGFEEMDRLRRLVTGTDTARYGITPDTLESSLNPEIDKGANLTRTWMPLEAYTAPVEWAVSGDQLLIQVFDDEGRVIEIRDAQVASAFKQIWKLLDTSLRKDPGYAKLPVNAKRQV